MASATGSAPSTRGSTASGSDAERACRGSRPQQGSGPDGSNTTVSVSLPKGAGRVRRSLVVIVLAAAIAGATAAPPADAGVTVDPRIAALQITMRSRLLYRGPVTGIVDGRTTSAIAILQTAPRRRSRRDLRPADASPALPVRHARARHAAADDRLQGLRRCAAARRARIPRLPVGAVLERVHRADGARGAPVPALRRTADNSDGRPAHRARRSARRCPSRRNGSRGRSPPRSRAATGCAGRGSTAASTSSPG